MSKTFDGLIHRRITSFFTKFNLLSDNQFGFRKNKNTELAILELVNKIMPAIENKTGRHSRRLLKLLVEAATKSFYC